MSNEAMVNMLEMYGYIRTRKVKEAFLKVDRANYVPSNYRHLAYADEPLPVSHGQTISAPSMVAIMLELLKVEEGHKVLEIGTGSGYNACLLACLGAEVITIERVPALRDIAKKNLERCPCKDRIRVLLGDGSVGYPSEAPYDRIIVTCGAPRIPPPLLEQLKVGGIMVIPVGGAFYQELVVVEKTEQGIKKTVWGDVVFVPLIGKYGHKWA